MSPAPRPAVRFPSPYRPAGSASGAIRPSPRTNVSTPRPTSTGGNRIVDSYLSGRIDTDRGPVSRPTTSPRTPDRVSPRPGRDTAGGTRPAQAPPLSLSDPRVRPSIGGSTGSVGGRGVGTVGKRPTQRPTTSGGTRPGTSPGGGARPGRTLTGGARGLRNLEATRPDRGREIRAAGNRLARARDVAIGLGTGIIGGTYRPVYGGNRLNCYTGYGYGNYGFYNPWGWCYRGSRLSFCFGNFGFSRFAACNWFWPSYVSCWYPYWYATYRPFYFDAVYSAPAVYSTIVYRTVYEDDLVADGVPGEAVGEVVVPAVQAVEQPAAAGEPQPLSIAAERYLTLGDRAFREGRYIDSVGFYAKAVDLAQERAGLHMVLADALFAAGDYHYAAYSIRKALELDPALAGAVVDKHDFYADPSEFDRQLAVLEQYAIDHPSDLDARLVLGLNLLFGNRPAESVSVLEAMSASSTRELPAVESLLPVALELQYGR